MRKKWSGILCVVLLGAVLIFAGCGEKNANTEPQSEENGSQAETQQEADEKTQAETQSDAATEEMSSEESASIMTDAGEILDVEHLTQEQSNMFAIMDSLNMCMVETGSLYDPQDPEFFWNALLYTIGNYPDIRDNESTGLMVVDNKNGVRTVNYKLVQEYATGIFAEYSDLPALPANCAVKLNEDAEYYDFPMGDRGASYSKVVSWFIKSDGVHSVEVQLLSREDDRIIAEYLYTLVDNPYADGITDPMFRYTIKNVEEITK